VRKARACWCDEGEKSFAGVVREEATACWCGEGGESLQDLCAESYIRARLAWSSSCSQ